MIGFKRLTEVCQGLFGLTISQGAIVNVLARAGEAIAAPADRRSGAHKRGDRQRRNECARERQDMVEVDVRLRDSRLPETRGKGVPMAFLAGAKPKMRLSDRLPEQLRHAERHQFCWR